MLGLSHPAHLSPTRTTAPHHQTPVKRTKPAQEEPLTAESEVLPVRSLSELDAAQLFEKFEQLVQVSVQEESFCDESEDVARCLDYDHPHSLRLHFDPASSMKKKPSELPRPSFAALNLFPVSTPSKELPVVVGEESFASPVQAERGIPQQACWATRKKDISE